MQCVGGRSPHDDCGTVLIIVENRDVHPLAADFLDDEAVRRLDVFKVDRAEGGAERADDFGKAFRIGFVQFDVETIDIGEFLEQDGLALHHRLGGQRPDIAQPQNGGAIGDDAHKVAARSKAAGIGRIIPDFQTGFGHAR